LTVLITFILLLSYIVQVAFWHLDIKRRWWWWWWTPTQHPLIVQTNRAWFRHCHLGQWIHRLY